MKSTQNGWFQRDIINRNITLTEKGLNTMLNQFVKWWKSHKNEWGQRESINRIKILTKQGSDKIHDVIQTKYQKYPSNTILNMLLFWHKEINRLMGVYTIWHLMTLTVLPIHIRTMTLADISHGKRSKIPIIEQSEE